MFFNQNDKLPERGPVTKRPSGFTIVFFLLMSGLFITFLFQNNSAKVKEVPYSDFTSFMERGEIESVTIHDNDMMDFSLKDLSNGAAQRKTRIPYFDPNLLPKLQEKNIKVTGAAEGFSLWRFLIDLIPWIIGFGLIMFMLRNMQGMGNKTFQFGKSRAKRYKKKKKKLSFADVAGQKDAKYELEEVVEY
jgi:cell division protease FtsH